MEPGRTLPPAGWYADPWAVAPWRWWDGFQWTAHVAPTGPLKPQAHLAKATWPSIGWMLLAMAFGVAAAIPVVIAALVGGAGKRGVLTAAAIGTYPAMFGAFWWVARRMSNRYGTGDMRTDFGWRRFALADVGWGLLTAIAAFVAQIAVGAVFRQPNDGKYREAVLGTSPNLLLFVVMGLAVVVGAPLFEELMFRGPIMASLVNRFGPIVGIVLQGAVFALYHVVGNPTLFRAWYLAPLFVVGVIFGYAKERTGRMATSQIAHALMNLVAFAALVASS